MNQLFDEDGMLIVRDPSVWSWKSPARRKLETWTKLEGDRRVCKSCGMVVGGKPTEGCNSSKHRSYYESGLRRHRKRIKEASH